MNDIKDVVTKALIPISRQIEGIQANSGTTGGKSGGISSHHINTILEAQSTHATAIMGAMAKVIVFGRGNGRKHPSW